MTKKDSQKKSRKNIIVWSISVLLVVVALCASWLYTRVTMPFPGDNRTRIYIPEGVSADDVKDTFLSVLGYDYGSRVFDLWKYFDGTPEGSHGSYVIEPGMKAYRAARMIANRHQTPVKLTFNNLRLVESLAGRVASKLETDSATFMRALDSVLTAKGYDRADYPAAFLPDTYEFYWTEPASSVVEKLEEIRSEFWTPQRKAKASALGLTPEEVATIASIVEEETAKADERPRVARLYINRLREGMKLQADPTVKFALRNFGLRRITGKHLTVNSPYNTYKNEGLPPGPIRIVEASTIDAVLDAPEHRYLYMCAKEDFSGYHNFARDYSTHLKNARRYQAALDARGIK